MRGPAPYAFVGGHHAVGDFHYRVSQTLTDHDLLRNFLTHPQALAIVVDEFGGTEGMITLSDIIEEIMSDAAPLGDADLYIEPLEIGYMV